MTGRVYTFPAEWHELVTECRFFLRPVTLSAPSLFGGRASAHGPTAHLWACEMSLGPTDAPKWRRISAFFSRVDGRAGIIRLSDPDRLHPLGTGLGNPAAPAETWSDGTLFDDGTGWSAARSFATVGADAVRGSETLELAGLDASQPVAVAAGDLLEAGGWLYEAVQDAASDASGAAGVEIRPRLRAGVAAGDMVRMRAPSALFMLSGDDQGVVDRVASRVRPWGHVRGTLGLSLVEVLR